MLQDKAVARRFASEKVQKVAFLAGAASDAWGEGHGRDHAANAGICLGARLPALHHLSALSTFPKKKHMKTSTFLCRM